MCLLNPWGCQKVKYDIQGLLDQGELVVERKCEDVCVITPEEPLEIFYDSRKSATAPLVIYLPRPLPHVSQKAIPYKYNATIVEDGHEIPIPPLPSVDSIVEDSRVLRNGRVIPTLFPKKASVPVPEPVLAKDPSTNKETGQSSGTNSDLDEVLKMIKKSEYKVIDQLLQTPSKISVLSLLLNSEAHRGALMRVLEQAFVDYDVSIDQFSGIVGNITACHNLSFNDEELPEQGKNHNLALHISVNCGVDALSNVLIDTGSSLNVMSKTTFDRLSSRVHL